MAEIRRTFDIGGRSSTYLGNERVGVLINDEKGMVPELTSRNGSASVNAHWNPWFRSTGGEPWDESRHAERWKVPLLYDIAGNFCCAPNFGPPHEVGGRELPAHGVTAAERWTVEEQEQTADTAILKSSLNSSAHPLAYKRWDMVCDGHPVHYARLDISNPTDAPEPFSIGWHNTVGPPFLESGCLIDNNATEFATPDTGTEFDATTRLAFGAEFDSLERVPLQSGGTVNLREVPGPIGSTDFVCGGVPSDGDIAWSAVVNPRLSLAYVCFFLSPASVAVGGIALQFYDLWMNYGGRHFMPWAAGDDLMDRTFCLGTENATGYFANGLGQAIANPTLMGRPTFLTCPSGESMSLTYATAFFHYEKGDLDSGVADLKLSGAGIDVIGHSGKVATLRADGSFDMLRGLG
jgi:hypothetical protein